eukprot:4363188-Pyramimonas_sp.AAC.1
MKELIFLRTYHDENFFYIAIGGEVVAACTAHVDDMLTIAAQKFPDKAYAKIPAQFGKKAKR